jgi:hypothetical protein
MGAHPHKVQSSRLQHHLRRFWRWENIITLGILLTAVLFAVFWYAAPHLRTFLVPISAAMGTLYAALAGFSDTARGKVVPALLAGILVGLGTWFTTLELDQERKSLQFRLTLLHSRLDLMSQAFLSYANSLSPDQRGILIRTLAENDLRKRTIDGESGHLADISEFMLQLDPYNGHGLYFSGLAWRMKGSTEQMRDEFKKYLSVESTLSPEERTGLVGACYARANGFCGERTGTIDHLLAYDFYRLALDSNDSSTRQNALAKTCSYLQDSIDHYCTGFERDGSLPSTGELQQQAKCGPQVPGPNCVRPTTNTPPAVGKTISPPHTTAMR